MGKVLTDEDGSNDREHDTAYAVFEAAQVLAPELATEKTPKAKGSDCLWYGDAIPADAPYYDVDGRECCERCRAAADRHGTPYCTERTDRETNFTDTVTPTFTNEATTGSAESCGNCRKAKATGQPWGEHQMREGVRHQIRPGETSYRTTWWSREIERGGPSIGWVLKS